MKVKHVIHIELIEEIDDRKLGGGKTTKEEKIKLLKEGHHATNHTKEVEKFVEKLEKKGLVTGMVDYHVDRYLTPSEQLEQIAKMMRNIEEKMEEKQCV